MADQGPAEGVSPTSPIQKSSTAQGGSGKNETTTTKRPPTTIDHITLEEIVRYVKKQRLRVVLEAEKLDILLLHAKLRHEQHREVVQTPSNRRPKAACVTPRICALLNREQDVVSSVWKHYWSGSAITVAPLPGNYAAKSPLMPRVAMVASIVQTFVRERRAIRQRTVARDVMNMLVTYGISRVNYDSPTTVVSAVRSVRRYLRYLGYKRGKKKGVMCYMLREKNMQKRGVYLSTMVRVKRSKKQRVIYLDESYVRHKYVQHDDSLFDPNDEQDLQITIKQKGRRRQFGHVARLYFTAQF